jgi:ankyrin repeat protein
MDGLEPEYDDVEGIVDAAKAGNLEEVRRLLQQDRRLLDADDGVSTPLTAAAEGGHVGVMRYLLEEGAQVDLRDTGGWTALERACHLGHLQAVSLLLAHGADAPAADGNGLNPLMFAVYESRTDVVPLLLAHGCGDSDRQIDYGWTALHSAVYRGHAGVVRALLGAGADPHLLTRDGERALALAARGERAECVAMLQVSKCLCNDASSDVCRDK